MRLLLLFFISSVLFSGCQKDELSRTKTNLSQTWVVSQVEFGGKDTTETWKLGHVDYSLLLGKDNKYFENYTDAFGNKISQSGSWLLSDDALKVTFSNADKQAVRTLEIILIDSENFNFNKASTNPKETYYLKSI